MARRITFPAPERVILESVNPAALAPGEVRLAIAQSLISTGTEMTAYGGRFNPDSHWGAYVRYPFSPGYSSTGTISEVGTDVDDALIGTRAFTMWPHASSHDLPALCAFPIPDDVDFEQANWCALAGVAYVGIRRSRLTAGESVAIIGAGPVGQMATRWAAVSGARQIIVIDPVGSRLTMAEAGGATDVLALNVADAIPALPEVASSGRPQVVIDTTGRADTFAEALPLVADFGRLVVLGDAGDPTRQHLTSDLISRGVEVIGAHGNYMPYVMGVQAWQSREGQSEAVVLEQRVHGWRAFSAFFFALVADGRFPVDGLVSHRFPAEDAAAAYGLLAERRTETMAIALDWPESH